MNIVLIHPKIPHNTGAIGRLCVGLDATLHLIKPLGFSLDDKLLKRAGLDYWKFLDFKTYQSIEHFWSVFKLCENHFFLTTKAIQTHFEASFKKDCFLYFGSEDAGISKEILCKSHNLFKIPMHQNTRSLNLAQSVSIVAYEAWRQINLP